MANANYLVEMKGLHKSYAGGVKPVLQGLDISMCPGDRVVVIGPSGGGKSTLLRVLMGLEDIDKGQLLFQGKNYITTDKFGRTVIDKDIRRNIGMVFQHYTLFPHLNILQNLTLAPIKARGESRQSAEQRARGLLIRFGLEGKEKAYPAHLSGGQKQRVAIARALMLDPKLMLFDEVTSALDPELVAEVEQVIMHLAEQSMPMVIVTHDMHFAKNIASRVIFCAGGVVVEDGPPEQVLGRPKEARTREFIQRVFHIGETVGVGRELSI
ncbi:amino acid ABC transporter ATP-binding protein [Pseudomonas sp. B21-017]|jgi:polar amino acid transport system ATP-binding protein|uniref:amino acid ABC transporter ATP-binding protein n=1 Tax=Pseudomonas TaxID=286 RepID=UPI000270B62B|nr:MULTISPECIES: amino acid ABC transporter ATP-binding protein [unclassified Pseudomonas]EJM78953.1 ABC-type polar amino acid transport system, ATPase component [Pseudomonas sp. GM55]UVM36067.1 amino acid ABC transporter ATP-binding protein [Pseudomonas sp. B21-017]